MKYKLRKQTERAQRQPGRRRQQQQEEEQEEEAELGRRCRELQDAAELQDSAPLHSLSSCGGRWRDADAAHSQTSARRRTPAVRVPGSAALQKFLLGLWLSSPWTSEQFGLERKAEAPRGETYPRLQLELLGRRVPSPQFRS